MRLAAQYMICSTTHATEKNHTLSKAFRKGLGNMPLVFCSLNLRSAKYLNWRGPLFLAKTIRNLDILFVKLFKIYLVIVESQLSVQGSHHDQGRA
jgi:hypothetical protein